MAAELISECRSRTAPCRSDGRTEEEVGQQLGLMGLAEIVASYEGEHGPLTEQEVDAARRELFGEEDARGVGRGAA